VSKKGIQIALNKVIIPILFEYDPAKSATNKEKHGIDFKEAQALWEDTNLVQIEARTTDEPRWLV
jgi:uncharacterized protein